MRRYFFWLAGFLVLLCFPCSSQDRLPALTDLRGCVFEKDGTSPIEHVAVYVKRIPDGELLKSTKTDRDGRFLIKGLTKGVYAMGVETLVGNFSARELVGIGARAGEYAKMYIALFPYSGSEDSGHVPSSVPDSIGDVVVLAGNAAVVVGISDIDDAPKEAGPFKNGRRP